jgi:hypothetical protein
MFNLFMRVELGMMNILIHWPNFKFPMDLMSQILEHFPI